MKTFKDIEEDSEKLFDYEDMNGDCSCNKYKVLDFIKKISNQIIDDMIGEELKRYKKGDFLEHRDDYNWGYNDKVQELKKFKEDFNK